MNFRNEKTGEKIKLFLGYLCLTPLSTKFQLLRGGHFNWWNKPENPAKTTDLPQVTDKTLSHNVVSSTPRLNGIRTHTLVVISTDCICSYKSN